MTWPSAKPPTGPPPTGLPLTGLPLTGPPLTGPPPAAPPTAAPLGAGTRSRSQRASATTRAGPRARPPRPRPLRMPVRDPAAALRRAPALLSADGPRPDASLLPCFHDARRPRARPYGNAQNRAAKALSGQVSADPQVAAGMLRRWPGSGRELGAEHLRVRHRSPAGEAPADIRRRRAADQAAPGKQRDC